MSSHFPRLTSTTKAILARHGEFLRIDLSPGARYAMAMGLWGEARGTFDPGQAHSFDP